MVKAEVDAIRSLNGKVEAEVDAGQGYVSVIGRAPKKGHQNVVLFRSPDSPELALVVFDENDADDPVSEWIEGGWEVVMSARSL